MRCPTLKDLPSPPEGKSGWPWDEESVFLAGTAPDGKAWPKISIVTVNYNYGQFIEETIRSVLLQGYPNLEYIIMDGGSTDNSLEIIKKYEKWFSYWTSKPDDGQSYAINIGFSMATGEILTWLNSDDIFCCNAFNRVAEYWVEHCPCHFLSGDGEFVDSTGKEALYFIKAREYSFNDLLRFHKGKFLPQPSVFFSSEAFRRSGGLCNELIYSMDLDLWLRMIKLYPLSYLPVCLSKLRRHKKAKTWKGIELTKKEVRYVLMKSLSKSNFWLRFYINLSLRYHEVSSFLSVWFRKVLQ